MRTKLLRTMAPRSLALVLACVASAAFSQDVARMDAVVRSHVEANEFTGAALAAQGDKILFSQGYGDANREWRIANTPTTRFRLGSITKQFTAACVLLLEERGKLRLDDPIKKLMPDAPAAWDKVTLKHLLTHTSGIPNFTSFPEYQTKKQHAATLEQAISWFRDKPLEFAPGERMAYSNSGYILLGYVIEKTGAMTYAQFLEANIFGPLGMQDSGYASDETIIAFRAAGYSRIGGQVVNAPYVHMSIPHAAGALYSTTEDLLRWNNALYGGKLLSAASLAKMLTPYKDDYALGVAVATVEGRKVVQHGGGIEGFNTHLAYYPESKITTVALSNVNSAAPQAITSKLGALAHGQAVTLSSERQAIEVPPDTLQKYVGTYALNPQINIMVTLDDRQLMAQVSGQQKFPAYPESERRFFFKVVDAQLEFHASASGEVTHAVLFQGGREMKAPRTSTTVQQRSEIPVPASALQRYVGVYELRPGFDLDIRVEGERLVLQATGQGPDTLYAEASDKFFSKVVDATIQFIVDSAGKVTHLTLKQGAFTGDAKRK